MLTTVQMMRAVTRLSRALTLDPSRALYFIGAENTFMRDAIWITRPHCIPVRLSFFAGFWWVNHIGSAPIEMYNSLASTQSSDVFQSPPSLVMEIASGATSFAIRSVTHTARS